MQPTHKIPITILICDEHPGDRMLTQQAFVDARIANPLRFVEGASQLLDYLYQRGGFSGETGAAPRPGLILLDLNPRAVDGREALRRIKRDATLVDIPVVVLTTSASGEHEEQCSQLGASAFTAKPVTFAGLVAAMNGLGRFWLEIVEPAPTPA